MLSLVTTVYRAAQFLEPFGERVDAAARNSGLAEYEMIFVVDDSPDDAPTGLNSATLDARAR
jgi:hypothetical protein